MKARNFITDINKGLSIEEVEYRINNNLVNFTSKVTTKSIKEIVLENIFTLFNIINTVLAIAIILVGSYKNLLYMLIIIANTLISIFQQIRSKKVLDKLTILTENKVNVIRNGIEASINDDEIVMDDIILLKAGNSILVDSIVRYGFCEVDESFITGESDIIYKKVGDTLLSGSFIVSGNCTAQVTHVGKDNYTYKIASDTKYMKPLSSEIMKSINKIIETVSIAILPIAILLFYRQLYLENNITNAVVNTTAAIIGMIPEGLVLLVSTVLAVSVYNLSKKNILVQDLYCIETLARVDTLCLDKTGTLTKGELEIVDVLNKSKENIEDIISTICIETKEENPTAVAIKKKYNNTLNKKIKNIINFSSRRKCSGIVLEDNTKYLMGAPEFVLCKELLTKYKEEIDKYSLKYRLIVIVKEKNKQELLGYILLQDVIREDAKDTLNYFQREGVNLKIISGDNPLTVKSIAERAGLSNLKAIDATKLKSDEDIEKAILNYDVFGRVTPEQKKDFVIALQNHNHFVAMTGDGVNDVLALKEADCSVAMASGCDATKNVSQIVLLDSKFSAMPFLVREGRKTINNIERSSSLFLVKTIYASLLSLLFIFISRSYPFIPIQLTLASISTIGLPAFILSFENNDNIIKGKFLPNIIKKVIPPALSIVVIILLITLTGYIFDLPYEEISTVSVFMTGFISFILLYKISLPLNKYRKYLLISMIILFLSGFIFMRDMFSFSNININILVMIIINGILSIYLYKMFEEMPKSVKKVQEILKKY